jgi:signal transduction histidine kinase
MRLHPALKMAEFAPLLAGVLLVAVWFSTPGPLRGQMLSMAASGVPIENALYPQDRMTAASSWLEADARAKAAERWADVRLRAAANKTSLLVADQFDDAAAAGTATPFMVRDEAIAFAPLKELVRDFPGTHVDAYLVESPPMPPVVGGGGVPLGRLPSSPFAAAWRASVGTTGVPAFDPKAWSGFSANATDSAVAVGWRVPGDNEVFSYSWPTKGGLLYRAYAFAPPRELLGVRTPLAVSGGGDYPLLRPVHEKLVTKLKPSPPGSAAEADDVSNRWCDVCHFNHSPTEEVANGRAPFASALWVGGPVTLTPKCQFTTRSRDRSARIGAVLALASLARPDGDYFATPSSLAPYTSDRYASAVWVRPGQQVGGGQTMLFVATYPSDPHGAFTAWRASWLGNAVLSLRLWLALQLPWLLAVTSTLLGVSLFVSPLAFMAERRAVRREETATELARIQRDAHDRVYNRLGALSKRVDRASADVSDEAANDLTCAAADIRATVADLQAILGGEAVTDGRVPGDALLAQLRATVAAQAALHGVDAEFSARGDALSLPARLGWDLQCVLDEAITNAARHGGASSLRVTLSFGQDVLRLEVCDDGVGPAADAEPSRDSTGIAGMRERLVAWGGGAHLRRSGAETMLVAEVPLPPRTDRG